MSAAEIVNKAWNYACVLREDDVGYGNNVEQQEILLEEFWSVEDVLVVNNA